MRNYFYDNLVSFPADDYSSFASRKYKTFGDVDTWNGYNPNISDVMQNGQIVDNSALNFNNPKQTELRAYEPNAREYARTYTQDALTGVGMDEYVARRASNKFWGGTSETPMGMGIADFTGLGTPLWANEAPKFAVDAYHDVKDTFGAGNQYASEGEYGNALKSYGLGTGQAILGTAALLPFIGPEARAVSQAVGKTAKTLPRTLSNEGFYYAADEALKNTPRKKGNPQAWANEFKKAGVPSAEMEWRKINQMLSAYPPNQEISKEEIANYLADKKLRTKREEHGTIYGMSYDDIVESAKEDIERQAHEGKFDDSFHVGLDEEKLNDIKNQLSIEYDKDLDQYILIDDGSGDVITEFPDERSAEKGLDAHARDILEESGEGYAAYMDYGRGPAELISSEHRTEENARNAARDYMVDFNKEGFEDDPVKIIEETGYRPLQGTSHFLHRTIPNIGNKDSYTENVLNFVPEDLAKITRSDRPFERAHLPHPSDYYKNSIGWTLEQDAEDALGKGKGGIRIIHEVQSPEGQQLSGQKKPLTAKEKDELIERKQKINLKKQDFDNNIVSTDAFDVGSINFSKNYYDLSEVNGPIHKSELAYRLRNRDEYKSKIDSLQFQLDEFPTDPEVRESNQWMYDDLIKKLEINKGGLFNAENNLKRYEKENNLEGLVKVIDDPKDAQEKLSEQNSLLNDLNRMYGEVEKRLKADENLIPSSPLVDTNSGLEALLKNSLHRAAQSDNDYVALSGPQRMMKRWNDEGVSKLYEKKVPDILLKLARQHDPKVKPEMVYPADRNFYNDPITYKPEEVYWDQNQLDLPFDSNVNPFRTASLGFPSHNHTIENPITNVVADYLDPKKGSFPYKNYPSSELKENYRPVYRLENAYKQIEGDHLYFSSKERAEEAMKIINQQLDDRYKKSPEEIIQKWKNENEEYNNEPYFGIRLTPEMKESILKNGFSLFALMPLLYDVFGSEPQNGLAGQSAQQQNAFSYIQ